MKVRNVISLAAANLGREDLVASVEDCAAEPFGELASLLRCYNLVENEVALDYFPLETEETFAAADLQEGVLPFTAFSYAPVEILSVKGESGFPLSHKSRPDGLLVPQNTNGVRVSYTYSPKEKEWGDNAEVAPQVSERLLSFGVCCEYCLTNGQYAEAAMWEKKYREALRAANIGHKKLTVRSRRWA